MSLAQLQSKVVLIISFIEKIQLYIDISKNQSFIVLLKKGINLKTFTTTLNMKKIGVNLEKNWPKLEKNCTKLNRFSKAGTGSLKQLFHNLLNLEK